MRKSVIIFFAVAVLFLCLRIAQSSERRARQIRLIVIALA